MEAIVNNLIKAIGWSIFHSLWQGAIIYGVLMLIVATIPSLNAKHRHNLAYTALCMIFAGFAVTFFSIFKLPQVAGTAVSLVNDIAAGQPANFLLTLPQEINSKTEHLFPYLVSVYTIGILFQLFVLSVGYRKLIKIKQAERSLVAPAWQAAFDQLSVELNIRRKVSFYLSANVNVPLVIGYFKPVVLFPIALASQLDMEQVEAILIHELSHIRRNDYLLNLIKTGIETILFFNPFIWLSGRYINIEREHACDDLVLKFTGTPITYAHALLKLEILKEKAVPALSMAATGGNQHLYQRIKRITDMKTNYMNAKQQLFAITLTVATVISLAWVNPAKTIIKKEKTLKKAIDAGGQAVKFKTLTNTTIKAETIVCDLPSDTTKKKKRFKIVTVDAKGEKKEYDSVKEMPDSLRQEVINDTFLNTSDFKFDFRIDSAVNKSMTYINSVEFKKTLNDAKMQARIMVKKFNSPEWKKQQADLQKNMVVMTRKFQSIDMKNFQKDMKKHAEEMKKHAEAMKKQFDSPEFKKQIQDMKKLQESPEYKELQEKYEKDLQKLKDEKGIKGDLKSMHTLPVNRLMIRSGNLSDSAVKVIRIERS
ncbi:MAG: M56 family metallopeptidase [Bacteroidota bacterium]